MSIIALLMALLLPVLGAARRDAQLIQSLSNLKQIGTASTAYQTDNDQRLPITPVEKWPFVAICTWTYGGKFSDSYWARLNNGLYDIAPNSRPLNDYIYPGQLHPKVNGYKDQFGYTRPRYASERAPDLDLPVFKSPRDIATMQRDWPNPTQSISSYDDVGTSYHYNAKWHFQLKDLNSYDYPTQETIKDAQRKWQRQVGFQPSRFVVYHDQVADAIRGGGTSQGAEVVDGDFGYENHSAMVFFDAHASLEEVIPNQDSGDNYDFVFDLR